MVQLVSSAQELMYLWQTKDKKLIYRNSNLQTLRRDNQEHIFLVLDTESVQWKYDVNLLR